VAGSVAASAASAASAAGRPGDLPVQNLQFYGFAEYA
jgi:hypothetical protein